MAVQAPTTAFSPKEPRSLTASGRATVDVTVLDLPEEVRLEDVEERLERHLERIRKRTLDARQAGILADDRRVHEELRSLKAWDHDVPDDPSEARTYLEGRHREARELFMSRGLDRVRRRAKRFARRKNQRRDDALGQFATNEAGSRHRERLSRLIGPVPAVAVASQAQANELAAALHAEMPWMGPATESAWRAMRRSARTGTPVRVGPMLLDGPPGIGKTSWAHRLAEVLGIASVELDASKGLASFSLAGVERGWGSAAPGRPLDAMIDARLANPLVIVDEIDKAGSSRRESGGWANLEPALLGLLEPESARNWDCPYYRLRFDMSHLSWVLTSNRLGLVSEPALSRVKVLSLPLPTSAELADFARRQASAAGLPAPAAEALCEAVGQAGERWQLSLRDVGRMIARAQDLADTPTVH